MPKASSSSSKPGSSFILSKDSTLVVSANSTLSHKRSGSFRCNILRNVPPGSLLWYSPYWDFKENTHILYLCRGHELDLKTAEVKIQDEFPTAELKLTEGIPGPSIQVPVPTTDAHPRARFPSVSMVSPIYDQVKAEEREKKRISELIKAANRDRTRCSQTVSK